MHQLLSVPFGDLFPTEQRSLLERLRSLADGPVAFGRPVEQTASRPRPTPAARRPTFGQRRTLAKLDEVSAVRWRDRS